MLRELTAELSGVENVGIVDWACSGEKGVADGLSTDGIIPGIPCATGVEAVRGMVLTLAMEVFCW